MRTSYLIGSGVLLLLLSVVGYEYIRGPTPIEELLSADAAISLQAYETSSPPEAGSTSVLILGTTHLRQTEHEYDEAAFDQVIDSLSSYGPDMVVVEYLPPDYPRGKGWDYRPDLALDTYAETWNMTHTEADSIQQVHRKGTDAPRDSCTLAKAYLLNYDLVNAHYYAQPHECPSLRQFKPPRAWMTHRNEDEMAQIGYPVARQNNIRELVPFDYQGNDAEWFIYERGSDILKSGRVWVLWNFWPVLPEIGSTSREYDLHAAAHKNRLVDMLHYSNSPEHIGLQYWAYEEVFPTVTWQGDSVGAQQTENYWRRNRRMFGNMQEAIERREADRVLVVVGSGHKYFLDELTRASEYRWVDPREWLPAPSGPATNRRPSG
jgi:hypothetical protein